MMKWVLPIPWVFLAITNALASAEVIELRPWDHWFAALAATYIAIDVWQINR